MPEHTNNLIHEKSPYLLQHAHNPVDWFPWSADALTLARREKKPIFLSIGYSSCHWCHVMERESFQDPDVAAVMNRYFVNIKVDREERPDLDQFHMLAVQAMGQQGGWPLSVWLTPDLRPFFGGTYFPPTARSGRPGFVDVLERIHSLWVQYPDGFKAQAAQVADALAKLNAIREPVAVDEHALNAGYSAFAAAFDREHGGFGGAPKFPRPATLSFLLRYYARTGNDEALGMAVATLRAMALGGIHDHLGGGYARYSVDARWIVPHFEKMLTDQAQIMAAAASAYQISGLADLAGMVDDIARYVRDNLTSPEGGFYCAEDADSEDDAGASREGAFYTWTPGELNQALDEKTAGLVGAYFGVTEAGTFENGRSVLAVSRSVPDLAKEFHIPESGVRDLLSGAMRLLACAREQRPRPALDDKVITAWNGLMISGLSAAFRALGNPDLLASARRAADFILAALWKPETRTLYRRYRDGEVAVEGFLDDHAYLAQGLLDLYEAALDPRYLAAAVEIAETMAERFQTETGALLFAASRFEVPYDGTEPSGNSVAAGVYLRLAEMTGSAEWRARAEAALKAASPTLIESPEAMPAMLCALEASLTPPRQIVIAGDLAAPDTRAMLHAVQSRYLPNTTLLHPSASAIAPWLRDMEPLGSKATAYICSNFACQAPITNVDSLIAALAET